MIACVLGNLIPSEKGAFFLPISFIYNFVIGYKTNISHRLLVKKYNYVFSQSDRVKTQLDFALLL